jgi:hypothetical protein
MAALAASTTGVCRGCVHWVLGRAEGVTTLPPLCRFIKGITTKDGPAGLFVGAEAESVGGKNAIR